MGLQDLPFELWKAVGDELIFTCQVTSETHVSDAVRVWIETMKTYEAESLDDSPLGTKGGAFIGTFPGPDSYASIPRRPEDEVSGGDVIDLNRQAHKGEPDHSRYIFDYFGPSIDTGFRILSQCSPRYFTMSAAVAFALSTEHIMRKTNKSAHDFSDLVLRPPVELKGVWSGQQYPLFALDLEYDSQINTAYRKLQQDRADENKITHINDLCRACFEDESWPFQTYLPDAAEELFKKEPLDPLGALKGRTASTYGAEAVADDPPGGTDLPREPSLGA